LGTKTAREIVQWLHAHSEGLGRAVPADVLKKPLRKRALVRTRAPLVVKEAGAGNALALVPLDQFTFPVTILEDAVGQASPARLDGILGKNRAPVVSEPFAANDYEAVQRWLATVADRPNTYRTYRKEAERLLLWAVYQQGKALSSLDFCDCVGYRDFLAALDADSGVAWAGKLSRADWIGPKNAPRGQQPWRPFAGPLSPRSQQHALTIVQTLFQFLVGQGYLWRNPFASVKSRTAVSMAVKANHSFNAAQWQFILSFLDAERAGIAALGEGRATARVAAAYGRNRFVIYLGYGTGLRLAELTAATLGDLHREAGEGLDDFYWVLNVVGKGNKPRVVPLPDRVAAELVGYLRARGLPADLQDCDLALPLIDRLRQDEYELPANGKAKTTLAPSSIYRSLKSFFRQCAAALEGEGNTVAAARLRAATTHWLRHTHGTLGSRAGIRQSTIRDSLGHASIATTGIYLNDDLLERKREMEKLFGVVSG
jgi:integrase